MSNLTNPPLPEDDDLRRQPEYADDDENVFESEQLLASGEQSPRERSTSSSPSSSLEVSPLAVVSSFVVFGLINNVLYVIILSAALDLVPTTTPKGVIAFFNIFPALIAKVGWPYISKGRVRYRRRVLSITALTLFGIIVIASSDTLSPRLLGISLASFSSGLGELTYLQLSTAYPPALALGGFACGTGAAGIAGAGLWWLVKGWGVKRGLGSAIVLPVISVFMLLVVLRPGRAKVGETVTIGRDVVEEDDEGNGPKVPGKLFELDLSEKWRLARPLVLSFMLPLFSVYVFEYAINQGIAPTLLYPLPTAWPLRSLIKTPRDYYPLYQLVYQTFVFLSRSSHLLGLPPLPMRLLSVPSIVQGGLLIILILESLRGLLGVHLVMALICLEGLCGGLAYVNTFYHVGRVGGGAEDDEGGGDDEKSVQEREWRIGVVGAADSLGIVVASLVAMPLELSLCQAQVDTGRDLCRTL